MLTRRRFAQLPLGPLIGGLAMASGPSVAAKDAPKKPFDAVWAKIESDSGGKLGVAILDTQSHVASLYHADERFPMCSTSKVLVVAAVLARVDAGKEQLARRVSIAPGDILSYAPVTKQHVGAEGMSVGELCEAAITLSDNTAANLLVESLGGPAAVTDYARALGDDVTRLDRIEPELNEAAPGDPRDTTTPLAMAKNLLKLATGTALSSAMRDQLLGWLVGCKTGDAKLRAGLPKAWRIGDKTGSGGHGSSNDVAVIWPTGRKPVIIAVYLTGTTAAEEVRNAAQAAVGRTVAEALAG